MSFYWDKSPGAMQELVFSESLSSQRQVRKKKVLFGDLLERVDKHLQGMDTAWGLSEKHVPWSSRPVTLGWVGIVMDHDQQS